MKSDDSSLTPEQFATVEASARHLLDRADAWGTFPTPVSELMAAAQLKVAPLQAFDENAMLRYLQRTGEHLGRLLRRAIEKVRGILDVHAGTIHVDQGVSNEKQRFVSLHEAGHFELPHQRTLFRWVQDCDRTLAPEVSELFEREANTFARLVLFQGDAFGATTRDEPFGIKVPINAAKRFGASLYASMREYVRRHHKSCAVIVLEPIEFIDGVGAVRRIRRLEMSDAFLATFGGLSLPEFLSPLDDLMRLVPEGSRRMSAPRSFAIMDSKGVRHECLGEGFKTPYNAFILIHERTTLASMFFIP